LKLETGNWKLVEDPDCGGETGIISLCFGYPIYTFEIWDSGEFFYVV
jgi:hypothetical protein